MNRGRIFNGFPRWRNRPVGTMAYTLNKGWLPSKASDRGIDLTHPEFGGTKSDSVIPLKKYLKSKVWNNDVYDWTFYLSILKKYLSFCLHTTYKKVILFDMPRLPTFSFVLVLKQSILNCNYNSITVPTDSKLQVVAITSAISRSSIFRSKVRIVRI